ncbi:MAG: ferrous iron transport protein A [Deltaproteobacteria bacterium]|nr:ferrous iron transport protein A [Deltaproteobacteria bacterium]MCK5709201.1 ferrous iron transport protein A [Deltaproteobacteria bacterium]
MLASEGGVAEVSDHYPDLLRYVGKMGLYPKTKFKVLSIEPFNGPIKIKVGSSEHILGSGAAQYVFVTEVQGSTAEAV